MPAKRVYDFNDFFVRWEKKLIFFLFYSFFFFSFRSINRYHTLTYNLCPRVSRVTKRFTHARVSYVLYNAKLLNVSLWLEPIKTLRHFYTLVVIAVVFRWFRYSVLTYLRENETYDEENVLKFFWYLTDIFDPLRWVFYFLFYLKKAVYVRVILI